MTIYMNSLDEKEKKLTSALEKLKNIKIDDAKENGLVNELKNKKQLEIEKTELEEKYQNLQKEHEQLSQKLSDFENRNLVKGSKQKEFSEKIDELNQETDTLIEEIDKWQM